MYLHSFLQLIHSFHIRIPKLFWGGAQTLLRPFSTGNGDPSLRPHHLGTTKSKGGHPIRNGPGIMPLTLKLDIG